MIESFKSKGTKDIFNGLITKAALKELPINLHEKARMKLDIINYANDVNDLRIPPSNHFEKLSGDRAGQNSIRINRQYRICFKWVNGLASELEITDYH